MYFISYIGVVSKVIPVQGHGSVKIGGDNWKAISSLDVPLQVGMAVEVIGFDGIVIKVKPVNMPYNTYITLNTTPMLPIISIGKYNSMRLRKRKINIGETMKKLSICAQNGALHAATKVLIIAPSAKHIRIK